MCLGEERRFDEAGIMTKKLVARRISREKTGVASTQTFNWRDFRPEMLGGNDRFATELTTYRDNLDELLTNRGKFVVIMGSTVVGVYRARQSAMNVVFRFAPVPVLVKRIVEFEPVLQAGHVAQ